MTIQFLAHQPGPLDTTTAGAARGVLRLAEMCDAVGIKPNSIDFRTWGDLDHMVHVDTREDMELLATHLGLPADVRIYGGDQNGDNANAERTGVWRDTTVTVYSPAITRAYLKAGA